MMAVVTKSADAAAATPRTLYSLENGSSSSSNIADTAAQQQPKHRRQRRNHCNALDIYQRMELCEHMKQLKNHSKEENDDDSTDDMMTMTLRQHYQDSYPLVYTMLLGDETRRRALQQEGAKQIFYPKSNEGWFTTLRVLEGRALGHILGVWCFVVGHAIVHTCLNQLYFVDGSTERKELAAWENLFGIALNGTLSLMLVFRQNRAAARWWEAREFWGLLVARVRSLTSGILAHGQHDPMHRDEAIRWIAAYTLSVMEFLKGWNHSVDHKIFCGILTSEQVKHLRNQSHPPLFASEHIRSALQSLFCVTADTPIALSTARSHQLAVLERDFVTLLDQCGRMERIKATPLPMVFVAHLRTFLVLSLLLTPYVWGPAWGWGTIPAVAIQAFAFLGIEAASAEVEQPFRKHAVNALNMDGYCIGALANILQMIRQHADRELDGLDVGQLAC